MGHATAGRRKWQCLDCTHAQYVHWVERNRRSRLRCGRCGSLWMEPASGGAKEEMEIGDLNVREHVETRGDIVKAKQ